MIHLYLARHGQTEMNQKKLYYGWLDVPINDEGLRQCEEVAGKLSNVEFDAVISSTLKRAYMSAEIMCGNSVGSLTHFDDKMHTKMNEFSNPIILKYDALREINFGKWEGLHYTEVEKNFCEEWELWSKDWINYCIPDGESFLDFYKRVEACFQTIIQENQDKKVLLVAHEGTLKIIATILLKMEMEDYWSFHFEYGKYSHFEIYQDIAVIKKINC